MFSLQYVLSVYIGSSDVCRETFLTARVPCVRAEEIDDYKRLKDGENWPGIYGC